MIPPITDPPSRRDPRTAGTDESGSATGAGPSAPTGTAPARNRWLTLVVLCVSLLLVSLDNTILNVALPAMVRSMHATSGQLQWVVDSFAVVFAGLLLVAGSLGDRLGRKRVFMAGLVVFATGSAMSALATTPDRLIGARAFMGIGAAAIMPSTLSILTNVFTGKFDRARAIGIWSGTTGLGVAVGPVVGGWLLAHFWWGSVFLVNVPIAVVGVVAAVWLVPDSKNPTSKRPDPIGAGLSILGMGLLLWGIIEAPSRTWTSPLVLGAVACSLAVLTAFVLWERRSSHAMLELSFFRSRRFSAAIGAMALVIFALMGGLFLLTQYLQFSLGFSAFQAGLRVAPIAAVLLVVAPVSSLLDRLVGTKAVVCTGMGLIAVGLFLLSHTTVRGTYLDALPSFFLMGIGTGLAFAPCTESVMGSLPLEQAGVGSATNSAALQVGGALGVGVLGSLLNTRYQSRMYPALAHYPIPKSVLDLINGSLGGALAVAGQAGGRLGAALASLGRVAFVSGMDLALTVGAFAVGTAAVVVLAVLPNRGSPAPPGVGSVDGAPQGSVDGDGVRGLEGKPPAVRSHQRLGRCTPAHLTWGAATHKKDLVLYSLPLAIRTVDQDQRDSPC
jgi:EmrB/QacA subfamily drug resistance transporter